MFSGINGKLFLDVTYSSETSISTELLVLFLFSFDVTSPSRQLSVDGQGCPSSPALYPPLSSFPVATHLEIKKSSITPAFWRNFFPFESPLEENSKFENLPVTSGEM